MGKTGGILVIVIVIGILGLYMATAEDQRLQKEFTESLETVTKEFGQGEKISFFLPPTFTDDVVASLNAERAFNDFSDDEIVQSFTNVINEILTSQQLATIINILPDNELKTYLQSLSDNELREYIDNIQDKQTLTDEETEVLEIITDQIGSIGSGGVGSLSYTTDPNAPVFTQEILSGITVIKRGEIVKVFGIISKPTPPSYFYNIEVTCCDRTEILQKTNLQTDSDGSFAYNFATNDKHPLGIYDVTIITLSEDLRDLIEYTYKFQLIK